MDRKIEKKAWPPRRIIFVSSLGIVLLLIAYTVFFPDTSTRLQVDTERVTISVVQEGEFDEFIPVNGTITPLNTYFLDAPEGGVIARRVLESGNMVKEGDVILYMTNSNLQLDVMSREAQLYEQINNIRNTRITIENNSLSIKAQLAEIVYQIDVLKPQYERNRQLLEKGLISEQDFEEINERYQYNLKRYDITMASFRQDSLLRITQLGQLDESERRLWRSLDMVGGILDNLELRAPIAGQLTMPELQVGQSISRGERLGQIDELDAFKVRAQIDEFYITRIVTGLKGTVDIGSNSYNLALTKVFPTVTGGQFEVDMEFIGQAPPDLRRGQTLRIHLQLGQPEQALILARGGFHQKTGGNWVFLLNESGTEATKQPIRINRQNPQFFEIIDGLKPGDRVITSSYDTYGDADKLILN